MSNIVQIVYSFTMDNMEKIIKNILKYKKKKNLSYLKIAKEAGIPFATLENIIYSRVSDVKVSTLSKIAKALTVKIDNLLT